MGLYNPVSSYRIQFNKAFTFRDAEKVIPYLEKLGVRTLYASPVFKAVAGSDHGYDVADPMMLNPEVGTEEDFLRLKKKLDQAGIGWVQDVVPNHMAYSTENPWIFDVLQKGRDSKWYRFFDILSADLGTEGDRKLMLPFFGSDLAEMLDKKELKLKFGDLGLQVGYYDAAYPVSLETYEILRGLEHLPRELKTEIEGVLDETVESLDARVEKLVSIFKDKSDTVNVLNEALDALAEDAERMKAVLDLQHYEMVHWQATEQRINFRRFFTINGLICLNIQDEDVFEQHHQLIFNLLSKGLMDGLRIDHIDGLYDPGAYLERLRDRVGKEKYLVVEKILEEDEKIPGNWPVQGTTGYEFLGMVNNVLTNSNAEEYFHRFLEEWTGSNPDFDTVSLKKKKFFLEHRFNGDLDNLVQQCSRIKDDALSRVDEPSLKEAIAGFLVHCPVYRIYGVPSDFSAEERRMVSKIFEEAANEGQEATDALNALRGLFLDISGDELKVNAVDSFFKRCMQFTGPLMAKGIEDTLFYLFNPFLAHNEVGDSPSYFGMRTSKFHKEMEYRQEHWPLSMNATSTHDTKRGADARARLNVLSDIPLRWLEIAREWKEMNRRYKTLRNGGEFPSANDEYFIYQSLFAHVPMEGLLDDLLRERFSEFMIKALREAKENTSWSEPDENYENDTLKFIDQILDPGSSFTDSLLKLVGDAKMFGAINSLVQLVLRNTAPGVPDNFQGSERWNFDFVDPDNRKPVDYERLAADLDEMIAAGDSDPSGLLNELWSGYEDGRIKQWVNHLTFKLRNDEEYLFSRGTYVPLDVQGDLKDHIIAFERHYEGRSLMVVLPLNLGSLSWPVDWNDTRVITKGRDSAEYKDVLSNKVISVKSFIQISELFNDAPISVLFAD